MPSPVCYIRNTIQIDRSHHVLAISRFCEPRIETQRITAALVACDRSLKEAAVDLTGIRLTGGLGGRAYYIVHGAQHDVEAALEAGERASESHQGCYRVELIPRPHPDMVGWLLRSYPFRVG